MIPHYFRFLSQFECVKATEGSRTLSCPVLKEVYICFRRHKVLTFRPPFLEFSDVENVYTRMKKKEIISKKKVYSSCIWEVQIYLKNN